MEPEKTGTLRSGFTTGACAAAAAKVAVMALQGRDSLTEVTINLPSGLITLPVHKSCCDDSGGVGEVIKDAGDDPDITDGVTLKVNARWSSDGAVTIKGGEGVGVVTKPGLSVEPGLPAINPVPRKMIEDSVREVTDKGVELLVSIPGGAELAAKTFNPRLGIIGGLSILGTTGIVKPFSCEAIRDTLDISLNVADVCNIRHIVLVPGRIGEKAARKLFCLENEQLVEVGNEWGFILDRIKTFSFEAVLIVGHAGKLAKLPQGQWDTHSSRSTSAVPFVSELTDALFQKKFPEALTVEGIFQALEPDLQKILATGLSSSIYDAVKARISDRCCIAVTLVNMSGIPLGSFGDHSFWTKK